MQESWWVMEEIDALHEGEQIEINLRRYRAFIVGIVVVWVVPTLLIMLGFYLVLLNSAQITQGVEYLFLGLTALEALVVLIAYGSVQIYTRNRLIVTNKRIIIVTQHGLSGHRVAQCQLEFIQDVSTDHPNFLAELLDYGDISFETSGKEEVFAFRTCRNPHKVAAKIVKLCRKIESTAIDTGVRTTIPRNGAPKEDLLDAEFELPAPPS